MKKSIVSVSMVILLLLFVFLLDACNSVPVQTQANTNYIITFNPNVRDQDIQQVTINSGDMVSEPEQPTRTDYVFTGWYTDKRCSGDPFDFSTAITDDMFLYAGWTTTKVRVTFDFGYDEKDPQIISLDGGAAISTDQIPVVEGRDNYLFVDWYEDSQGIQSFDFTETITKNITIYAYWQQLKATVTFDLDYFDAQHTPEDQILDILSSEKVIPPESPVRGEEGDYLFEGWYSGAGKQETLYDFDSQVTGDLELHAKWTMLRATLTYDMNYGSDAAFTEKVTVGSTASQYDQAARDGYDFDGWFFDKYCTIPADLSNLVISDDLTVYAVWTAQERTIIFNYNYSGAPEAVTVVSLYDALTVEPEEPVKSGDEFIGWFTDSAQKQSFTFGEKLTEDLTLYAGWSSTVESTVSSSNKYVLTFYINDGTNDVYQTEEVSRNKYSAMRINGVSYPTRDGYKSFGWYTTPDCQEGTNFNVNTRITSDLDLYVKWYREYVFEAELTQLTDIPIGDTGKTEDKLGFGESSNPKGLYLIEWDCYNAGASNDYYISYLYNPGSYLEFCLTAAEDITNATLILRLTPELHDMYFATGGPDGTAAEKDGYKIYINPVYSFNSISNAEILESYDQIFDLGHDLTGAVTKDEDPNYTQKRAFEDYTITVNLNLRQGDNVIRLVTENTHDYGGSMHSAAPMVDCIKIYAEAEIGWTEGKEYVENLEGIDVRWPAKQN